MMEGGGEGRGAGEGGGLCGKERGSKGGGKGREREGGEWGKECIVEGEKEMGGREGRLREREIDK